MCVSQSPGTEIEIPRDRTRDFRGLRTSFSEAPGTKNHCFGCWGGDSPNFFLTLTQYTSRRFSDPYQAPSRFCAEGFCWLNWPCLVVLYCMSDLVWKISFTWIRFGLQNGFHLSFLWNRLDKHSSVPQPLTREYKWPSASTICRKLSSPIRG